MDVIWNCAFGVDLDCQHNPSNKFFVSALEIFDENQNFKLDSRLSSNHSFSSSAFLVLTEEWPTPFLFFQVYFYEFRKYILGFLFASGKLCAKLGIPTGSFMESRIWLFNNIRRIIDNRIEHHVSLPRLSFFSLALKLSSTSGHSIEKEPRKDYLNIVLDVLTEQCDKNTDVKSFTELKQVHLQRQMTYPEIIANLNGFMIAGYETTSATLNYCFYVLATHPDQLTKLQDELDSLYQDTNVSH